MEAKELRIGNYINLIADGHEHEPDTFQWSIDDYEYYETVMFNIIPIPLTEEWLLRFGFRDIKNVENVNFKEYRQWERYSICIQFPCGEEAHFYAGNYPVAIRYVHQLQNLYFALTGEELTIK
tara:strand:+ start:170 stop:538 length:369 start_codon:yes stop_codon:yes gene_type:complete